MAFDQVATKLWMRVASAIYEKRVNWVLDADIQGFFDEIDRDWSIKFLEHWIGDHRIVRLIGKWLNAGIIEETEWSDTGNSLAAEANRVRLPTSFYTVFRHT